MQDGYMAQRAVCLTEILLDTSVPQLHDLFRYDSETGSFHPDSIDELIKDSRRLRHATRFLGISDIEEDLQRRMALLQQCVNQKAYWISDMFKIISQYYNVTDPMKQSYIK